MGCIVGNAALTRILSLCGVPNGDKMIKKFNIPSWILKGQKKIQSEFLRRSFTCDGSISYNKNCERWEIRYQMHKADSILENCRDYLNRMKKMLKKINIFSTSVFTSETHIRNKDKLLIRGLEFKIYKPKSILNFGKNIGFDIDYKNKKLENAIEWAEAKLGSGRKG